ncbi:MAG TPA: rod shape-determining protein MreC [bacterium]|jgi:rod shape-determining protein MreC|nr:rod shape-determining protein MreC [bacterium]
MLKFFLKNLSGFFLAAILFVCAWLLVHRSADHESHAARLKNLSISLWLPVQKSVTWLITFPENTLNAVRELRNLRQEVDRLQLENQSLRLELSNQKSVETELARLKDVLQIKSKFPKQAQIARIIAHDPSTWNSSFVVDAGSEAGIVVDSPVISEQGIVGRVLEVTPNNSRVLIVSDTDSSVAGIDERSRVTGIVLGTGRSQLKFGYVSAGEDVQKDDVIVSSGMGGVFPKGYALGTVVKKTESENGLNMEIEVQPAVDVAALDYVFILPPEDVFQ